MAVIHDGFIVDCNAAFDIVIILPVLYSYNPVIVLPYLPHIHLF